MWAAEPTTKEPYWAVYSNLMSLKLIGCVNVCPIHVPELVHHFDSLEHLIVSECHDNNGRVIDHRTQGWSTLSDRWWNQRKPLTFMQIEHLSDWEVLAMGTIPTTELTSVRLRFTRTFPIFKQDEEIFPHLKVLCLEFLSDDTPRETCDLPADDSSVSHILEMRGIEVRRDAEPVLRY
jgi:hypothetical protein